MSLYESSNNYFVFINSYFFLLLLILKYSQTLPSPTTLGISIFQRFTGKPLTSLNKQPIPTPTKSANTNTYILSLFISYLFSSVHNPILNSGAYRTRGSYTDSSNNCSWDSTPAFNIGTN